MPDVLIRDNLQDIISSIELIEKRFNGITSADDFVLSEGGILILDSICMRLQIVGELVKKIQKIDPDVFEKYPGIEWQNIMKLRDIISHHYEHVDHEIIYDICMNHLPNFKNAVHLIYKDQTGSL
ncbi:MAG: DUF86 domain-containing protein [Desulfobacterales bacterium]|nr:DUF86 domain-containing protein [Desulfobacterales bacterium]